MPVSQEFVFDRTMKTISAQTSIAAEWVWSEKTLAQWEAAFATFKSKIDTVVNAKARLNGRRGGMEEALKNLHEVTVVYLTLLKTVYRNDEVISELLAPLTASGGSRNDILDQASELQSAWQEVNPTWEPKPGKTLAEFVLLVKDCSTLKTEFTNANTAWRNRASELRKFVDEMNSDCVGWYAGATVVFSAETSEGAMIRGTVPTTYSKSKVEPVE